MRKPVWILLAFGLGCGSSNGSLGGQGGNGAGGNTQPQVCHDEFNTSPDGGFPVVPCCPDQPPDCSGVPDGTFSYPPVAGATYCATTESFFCFCACHGSTWECRLDSVITPGGGVCGPHT
jgi:hypothetical protein